MGVLVPSVGEKPVMGILGWFWGPRRGGLTRTIRWGMAKAVDQVFLREWAVEAGVPDPEAVCVEAAKKAEADLRRDCQREGVTEFRVKSARYIPDGNREIYAKGFALAVPASWPE